MHNTKRSSTAYSFPTSEVALHNFLSPGIHCCRQVYDKVSASASYGEFVKKYTEQYVHEQDRQKLQEFLASEKLTEHLVDGCMEEDMRDLTDLTDLDIRMD